MPTVDRPLGLNTAASVNADPTTAESRRATTAACVGNVLEWYDFAVYGYLATIIAARFFSPGDPVAALLASFAVFGVGFVARPLGGFFIGRLADRRGRKPALMATIVCMAFGTLLIGVTPSYATIGIAAPVLLVLARLIQGFSAGGEWGTATSFLVEWAPRGRRGFFGSLQQSTVMLGLLLGSGVAALLSSVLSTAAMEDWGWRVPFLLGSLIGPVGLYMRRNVAETPVHVSQGDKPEAQWGAAIRLFALVAVPFTVVFTFMSYLPTFTQKYGGLTRPESLWANTFGLLILFGLIPAFGALSDRIGRRPLLIIANAGFLLLSYPLLSAILNYQGFGTVVVVHIVFGVLYAAYAGAGAAAYVELFKTSSRLTWLSTSYNIAGIFFGAFAGYIATWLIQQTGSPISVVYFVLLSTILSGAAMIGMKETAFEPIK